MNKKLEYILNDEIQFPTINSIIAILCADIEIFLFKKDQQDLFSKEEIINQLKNSSRKLSETFFLLGYETNEIIRPKSIPNGTIEQIAKHIDKKYIQGL